MGFNPLTGLEEEDDLTLDPEASLGMNPGLGMTSAEMPGLGQPQPMSAPAPMNPMVKDHLMKKFNLGDYSDENRAKLAKDSEIGFGDRVGAALSALSAGFMGKDPGGAGSAHLKDASARGQAKLSDFDKARANKIQEYSLDRQSNKDAREDAEIADEADLNSQTSKIAQMLATKMVPGIDFSGMSAAQLKAKFPSMEKIMNINQRAEDVKAGREERRSLFNSNLQDKREARAAKEEELSVPRAKQRGLYESGLKAEEQYQKAVGDKEEYDPTGVGQFIDNSDWAPNLLKNNKAIEAQAAQSAWIESFLRDASGAAIPPSERGAYAKDFFPQPGDPEDVVANKGALRQQKMDNALVGAGRASIKDVASRKTGSDPAADARRKRIAELKAKLNGPVANK